MFSSIRSKTILLFFLFSFVPLLTSRMVIFPKVWRAFQEVRIRDLESVGHKQSELISVWMKERKGDAAAIARAYLTSSFLEYGPDDKKLHELVSYLNFVKDNYGYKEISLADNEGKIRVSTREDFVGLSIAEFEYFREAKLGQIFVSQVHPSVFPVLNEFGEMERGVPTLFVSGPIRDDSHRIVGVVSLRVDIIDLSKVMRRVKLGETGETYLVDENGYMLTESRFISTIREMGLIKKRSSLELKLIDPTTGRLTKGVEACLGGESGYDATGYPDYRGVNVLGFWHWIPEYNWGLISEIDVDEAYKDLYELDKALYTISFVLTLVVMVAAIFLGRRLTAPILQLTEVTNKMSGGDLSQRVSKVSKDEIGLLAASFNIMAETIEKRNEELEATKQYLESMFDAIRDVIIVVNKEGIILRVNQAAIDEYGEDIIGKRHDEVFMDKDCRCEVCMSIKAAEKPKPAFAEHVVSGKEKVFFTESYPLLDGRGNLQAIIIVSRDITRQKQMEQKLQRYTLDLEKTVEERTKAVMLINKELEEKNKQLEKANLELRTLDRLKDSIIRDVSHELKSPAAQVKMAFDLWFEEKKGGKLDVEKEEKLAAIIQNNVSRLQKTILAVLDLSSIESGQIKYKKEKLQLKDLVQKVAMGYALVVEKRGLSLKTSFPTELPEVRGDKEHLSRVISNLIDNAIKYTLKGEIIVSGEERDGNVEIHVRDTGIGISLPKEEYDKLFQRFYQERPRYDGVGVGLAICRAIVEAHGGKIWAESEGMGKGATLSFSIPITGLRDEAL